MVKYRASALPVRHRSQPRASTDATRWIESRKSHEIMKYRLDIGDTCDIWYNTPGTMYITWYLRYITFYIIYLEYITSQSDIYKMLAIWTWLKMYQLLWISHLFGRVNIFRFFSERVRLAPSWPLKSSQLNTASVYYLLDRSSFICLLHFFCATSVFSFSSFFCFLFLLFRLCLYVKPAANN